MRRSRKQKVALATLALCVIATGSLVFGKRPARALVTQPGDYLRTITSEVSQSNGVRDATRGIYHTTRLFWGCFEVRMVDGRAFSGLPYYQELKGPEILTAEDEDIDIDFALLETGSSNKTLERTAVGGRSE